MSCFRKGVSCAHKLENDFCKKLCSHTKEPLRIMFKDGREWSKVYGLDELLKIVQNSKPGSYMLVSGNTAHGKPSNIYLICN